MRKYILSMAIIFYSQCLFAQSDKQAGNWLYGLPSKKSAGAIKKAILKNDNFEDDRKGQSDKYRNAGSGYRGKIIKPLLPKNGSIDSAKIYLVIGTQRMPDAYSGKMKWLRFEYFSADTLFLNELFDSACMALQETSVEHKPTGHRIPNQVIAKGINFTYVIDSKQYRSISASRARYSSGKQSFIINYSGSDD